MNRPTRSVVLFYLIFLVTGAATVLLSILLADRSAIGGGDRHVGTLLGVQFGGQVLGPLLLTRRPERSLAIGLGVTIAAALGIARVARPEQLLTQVCIGCLGVGLGMVMASVNVAAGQEVEPARRGQVLEMLNVFWPIGAALCAPMEVMLHRYTSAWNVYAVLAGLFGPCLLGLMFTRPEHRYLDADGRPATRRIGWRLLALVSVVAGLMVGVETGVAVWLPTLATRIGSSSRMVAAIAAGFWCGSLLSRLAASYVVRRVGVQRLCVGAAAGLLLCALLLPAFAQPVFLLTMAVALACCVAPLYPGLLAGCVDVRGNGVVFMTAGLGSALLPWLIGRASGAFGSLRLAMLLPAVGAVLILVAMGQRWIFAPGEESV